MCPSIYRYILHYVNVCACVRVCLPVCRLSVCLSLSVNVPVVLTAAVCVRTFQLLKDFTVFHEVW